VESSYVKKFATTGQEVSDLPYKIIYDYYTIKFKRRQLIPENYVTGDTSKEDLDGLAENVILKIEEIKNDYNSNLKTANEIKIVYDLLQTYLSSLEKLSSDKYSSDFEKNSVAMGNKMNGLVNQLNKSSMTKINLSLNPGEWLTSIATSYGSAKIKNKQAQFLKEYIDKADTLVQAINLNFQEIQVPIMNSWFNEEKRGIRDQFKRSIAPYLQNINRHPDSAVSIVAIDFFSRINPVYYELTDNISKDELLIKHTSMLMQKLADTHGSLREMFASNNNNWLSITEQVEDIKKNLSTLQQLFSKEDQDKFNFYKNFILQNENTVKDILNKH